MICEKCEKEVLENEWSSLTKRQIVALLEKAVMDGRLFDTKLFQYEAMGTMDSITIETLFNCFKSIKVCSLRSSKRLLRVNKIPEVDSEGD